VSKDAVEYERPSDGTPKSAYVAGGNHTMELSRLNAQYAEAYDKWENCKRDAERKRRESEDSEKRAVELRATVDVLRDQIKQLVK